MYKAWIVNAQNHAVRFEFPMPALYTSHQTVETSQESPNEISVIKVANSNGLTIWPLKCSLRGKCLVISSLNRRGQESSMCFQMHL